VTTAPFVTKDDNKRTNPAAILPGVQSIIAIAVSQSCGIGAGEPAFGAELSSLGTNVDYHGVVKGKLKDLADELQKTINFKYKILVDSPTLDERAFAARAGLGFFGKHGLLISPQLGTRFNIGLMLTTIPLAELAIPAKAQVNATCPPGCNRCINACPNNALEERQPLKYDKCISYLTQKKELTLEEEKLLHGQLFGCDICQDACPCNKPRNKTYINPTDWISKTDEDFIKEYGHTSILWQGAEILRRNARLSL